MDREGKAAGEVGRSRERLLNPLWVISLFVTFSETALGIAVTATEGSIQVALTCFVVLFPIAVAGAFFAVLWKKPWHLYAPHDFTHVEVSKFVRALKGAEGVRAKIQKTTDQVDRLSTLMAETRLLELEIVYSGFPGRLTDEQRERMEAQIQELRKLTQRGRA